MRKIVFFLFASLFIAILAARQQDGAALQSPQQTLSLQAPNLFEQVS